jgi:hypothetical protein
MKRFLVTILAVLYMAGAMGATVHIHYCMGEPVGASLIHDDEHLCGKCGMKTATQKKGCCKDEQKTFKAADHQLAKASFDFSHQPALVPTPPVCNGYAATVFTVVSRNIAISHSPPFVRKCPIYLLGQNFRI